jgi:hypothetical protein
VHISTTAELIALTLTVLVHFLGVGVLIWGMMDPDGKDDRPSWRDWWPRDEGPEPPAAPSDPRGGGARVPILPDAPQSPVRLREPGRIGEGRPKPPRRPEHAPEPAPAPDRDPV